MSELALGIRLTADGKELVGAVHQSTDEIGKMGEATKQAASEAQKLNAAQKDLAEQLSRTAAARASFQNIPADLDRLNDAGRRVVITSQSIADGFDQQGRAATRAAETQALLNTNFASYKTAQAAAVSSTAELVSGTGKLAEGLAVTSGGAIAAALSTAQARRELIVLGHEAMTGNVSRMPGSFMVLASRIGLTGGALVSVILPIAAVAGAAFALIKAFHGGAEEANEMNKALALTSGYAGMTRGTMRELAASMTDTGTITIGTAKGIVTQLVTSGQIGAQAIGAVALLASDYAAATGKDVAKIAPDLEKLFADPAKGAEELNKQMHFLSPAQIEHIAHLERIGELDRAQLELAQAMADHIPKQIEQLGYLGSAWNGLKKSASWAWDAMLGIGRPQTLEEKLADAQKVLAAATAKNARAGTFGFHAQPGVVASAQGNVDVLTSEAFSAEAAAATNASVASANAEQNRLATIIAETSEFSRMAALTDKIAAVRKRDATGLTDAQRASLTSAEQQAVIATQEQTKARAIVDLEKQKADIAYGMGAEGRKNAADAIALAQGRIADATKLYEVQNKSSADEAEAQLKLGLITKTQHDDWLTWLALANLARNKSDAEAKLALGGLTALQQQGLRAQIVAYDAMAVARQDKGTNQSAIDAKALQDAQTKDYNAQYESVVKLGDAENKRLNEVLAKAVLYNAEIGKTVAQKELEKKAAEDAGNSQLQAAIDSLTIESTMYDLDTQGQALYAKRLSDLRDELATRQQISAVMADSALKDAASAATKAQGQGYDKLFNEVERQGKAAFVAVMGHGEGAAKAIGAALKTSVLDLLYELTVKKFIVNIAANVAQGAGIDIAGTSLAKAVAGGGGGMGNVLGMASNASTLYSAGTAFSAGGFFGGGNAVGTVAANTLGIGLGAGEGIGAGGALAATIGGAEGVGVGVGGAAAAGGIGAGASAVLAAIPVYGWVALAAAAAYAYLSSGAQRTRDPQFSGLSSDNTITQAGLQAGPSGMAFTSFGSSGQDVWGGSDFWKLPAASLAAFNNAITKVFTDARIAAKALGLDTSALASVQVQSAQTGNGIQADMAAGLLKTADVIAQTLMPNVANFQQAGETLAQTFGRLTVDTIAVQNLFKILGHGVKATVDMSEQLVTVFGGVSNLQSQFQAYYQAFYTQAEQDALATKQVADAFSALHLAAPTTREQFKSLVDSLNLTTASGMATFKALMDLAPAVDAVSKAADTAAAAAKNTADAYLQMGASLADAVRQLRGGDLSPLLPAQKLAEANSQLNTLFGQARTGDLAALAALPQIATDFLTASRDYNASSTAYTADFNRVMSMLASAIPGNGSGLSQNMIPAHASGLPYVPRDDYLMRAHQGEAVVDAGTMSALRGYGIQVGAGLTKADLAELVAAVKEAKAAILSAAQSSNLVVREQTARLETASKESAREMGNAIAGSIDAKTLA